MRLVIIAGARSCEISSAHKDVHGPWRRRESTGNGGELEVRQLPTQSEGQTTQLIVVDASTTTLPTTGGSKEERDNSL